MRAVLIAVVGLSTLPALAQPPPPAQVQAQVQVQAQPQAQPAQIQQSRYRDEQPEDASLRHMTKPVIVERELLLERLASVNEKLSEAIGRSKKDKRLLKVLEDARAELKDVGRQVTSAPAYQPAQPYPPPQNRPPPPPQQQVQPITDAMLRSMVSSIQDEPFAGDKMMVLEQATPSQYFLVSQVQQILPLFTFPADRLKAMRLLRPRLLDLENGYQLYSAFEFSKDKEELKRILQQ